MFQMFAFCSDLQATNMNMRSSDSICRRLSKSVKTFPRPYIALGSTTRPQPPRDIRDKARQSTEGWHVSRLYPQASLAEIRSLSNCWPLT